MPEDLPLAFQFLLNVPVLQKCHSTPLRVPTDSGHNDEINAHVHSLKAGARTESLKLVGNITIRKIQ